MVTAAFLLLASKTIFRGVSGFRSFVGRPTRFDQIKTTAVSSRESSARSIASWERRKSDRGGATISFASSAAEQGEEQQPTYHIIKWITSEETVEFTAADGDTLRTAALRSGSVSPHNSRANLINCRGLGTCGTCAVSIHKVANDSNENPGTVSSPVEPAERSTIEQLRLSVPPGHGRSSVASDLRLACQVQVRGNLKVTKYTGFWGQDIGQLAKKSLPTQPFGELEFLLDTKSPEKKS